ncbi:MAG: DsrE/DsrF/DrsH-like family protein [Candidatus Heimdallarchaeota archaeon]
MAETKKMSIVVHSGTFDKVYPALMLAAAGGAMDMEVNIFFTFWGLLLLKKKGLKRAKLPGLMALVTPMMRWRVKQVGIESLPNLLKAALETENVNLYACEATMSLMMVKKKHLIPEIKGYMGAAGFLDIAVESDVQLFI